MKILFFLVISLTTLTSAVVFADDTICYDQKNAFSMKAPEGWVADSAKAKELGLCVVYFLKGKDFDSSPAIIYPKLTSSTLNGKLLIETIISEDTSRLKANSKKLKVLKRPVFKSKSKLSFEIRHFQNGPSPNEFEAVAYHSGDHAALLAVLSARNQKDFKAQKAKLTEFIDGITPLSQDEIQKFKANEGSK